jgi:transcriptional regulator with GAF, ATPase, and Fis domain
MKLSSPKIEIDHKLLAIEELFRQRQYAAAARETAALKETEFKSKEHEHGLFLSLKAAASHFEGNYKDALEFGLRAVKELADCSLNSTYGRAQLVLSQSYSAVGDLKNAEMRARDALASYRRADDRIGQGDALNELARIAYIRCNYKAVYSYLEEALEMVGDKPRKHAQITGNMGRILLRLGQWDDARTYLNDTLKFFIDNNQEVSQVNNLLDIGFLQIRLREFADAVRSLNKALEKIVALGLKREKIYYLEYYGELLLEKGDYFKAKAVLTEAYQKSMMLAPGSALVTQSGRRLAEAELSLDNADEAMKYGQKALELALAIGEKAEIGLSRRVIAQIFASKGEFTEATENIEQAVEVLREVGDPYDVGRTLVAAAEIKMRGPSPDDAKAINLLEEARRIFKKLNLDYWKASCDYDAGVYSCQKGDLARGFAKLSRAEKLYNNLGDTSRVRAVSKFLKSLSDNAVALAISQENSFKIFGELVSAAEFSSIKKSSVSDILNVLIQKCGANRAFVYSSAEEGGRIISTFSLGESQAKRLEDSFKNIIGEEIATNRPTLLLDCRRDPFINGLISDTPEAVASVIVVPFGISDGGRCYLYLDRLSADGLLNPFSQTELNFAVGFSDLISFKWAEIQKNELLEDNRRLRDQLQETAAFPNIITQNGRMFDILSQVRQIVNSNISVTIEGETGTGKDLLARAIHFNSVRRDKRFVSINCAALPETLLESELFGYKRGAFTGADRDKGGLIEEADGGTFFLDEIADMPLSIQAKILRVLESKEIIRLGETTPRTVDVRIISATNKDLKAEMKKGSFRQDLYYRLSAMTFVLPALRERKEDILLLVSHFLEGSGKTISPEALKLLNEHDWPGNIRELDNEVKRLVLLAGNNQTIEKNIVSAAISGHKEATANGSAQHASINNGGQVSFDTKFTLYDYLAEHEKHFILQALKEKHGIKKHAAAMLNIPESTLRLKMKQYSIELDEIRPS